MHGLLEWEDIKDNRKLLENSVKLNKEGELNDPSVCECVLYYFEDVDKDIYDELVKIVYTYPEIARISKFVYSLLQLSLNNPDLKLTEDQKEFACSEAKLLPGAASLVNNYIHGASTPFDIRYSILVNNNWTDDEKKGLIFDFYKDKNTFNEAVNRWEDVILNNDLLGYSKEALEKTKDSVKYIKNLRENKTK